MGLVTDNEWHPAIVVRYLDGNFGIYDDLTDAQNRAMDKLPISGQIEYQDVKYNWNRGQPIVDFGAFKAEIVDIDFKRQRLDEVND